MQLDSIKINNFRNLLDVELNACNHFNIICGENGSGKTSILEAIYYLGHTKSFRTHLNTRITHYDASTFTIISTLKNKDESFNLGINRNENGSHTIKLNSQKISSIAQVAKMLPMQLMSNISYTQFSTAAKFRRKFLNWGLFHVKPVFYQTWKEFESTLKQRNSALKQRLPKNEMDHWNIELTKKSQEIHELRQQYVLEIEPIINDMLNKLLGINHNIEIKYHAGWNTEENLIDILENNYYRDMSAGFTNSGAHRADFQLTKKNIPIHFHLSQGQQKVSIHALSLAQGKHLEELTGKKTIYLIDDLPSELDSRKLAHITEIINEIDSQIFITSIEENKTLKRTGNSIINIINRGNITVK